MFVKLEKMYATGKSASLFFFVVQVTEKLDRISALGRRSLSYVDDTAQMNNKK